MQRCGNERCSYGRKIHRLESELARPDYGAQARARESLSSLAGDVVAAMLDQQSSLDLSSLAAYH
jgi:hypothetical protein